MMKSLMKNAVILCGVIGGLYSAGVPAYGGGGSGSSSCIEPRFYEESPPKNAVLSELVEVSVVASDNMDIQTLEWEVGTQKVIPTVSIRRSGELGLKARLPVPLRQAGKVRIALTAKSKDGCDGYFPYFVEIKP